MDIAIPKEAVSEERRVGLAPSGVDTLVRQGHRVYVESQAGVGGGFDDAEYEKAGAALVFNRDEVFRRAELVVKVWPLSVEEARLFGSGQKVASFVELGLQTRERMDLLRVAGVTAYAFDNIIEPSGLRPFIQAMGEITAGRIPIIAGRYMNSLTGGRGIVLGDVPGVPPATVLIIGAGTVGSGAARHLGALGARVILLDIDLHKLRAHVHVDRERPQTLLCTPYHLERHLPAADIVVGAVSAPGDLAPRVLTRTHMRLMRPRSLFIDVAIDQGGCAETSHPTTHSNATYVEENVTHYCVPNIPSSVARSSSYALTNAALPYVSAIASGKAGDPAIDASLRHSIYMQGGLCTHEKIAKLFGLTLGEAKK